MGKLKITNESYSEILDPEVDAILAILEALVEGLGSQANRGAFILDGEAYTDEEASCILEVVWPDSDSPQSTHGLQIAKDAAYANEEASCILEVTWPDSNSPQSARELQIAKDSIDTLLAWPEHDSRFWQQISNHFIEIDGRHYPGSRVYHDRALIALVMNGQYGRFIASLKIERAGVDLRTECREILCALSIAIAHLFDDDKTLQGSVHEILTGSAVRYEDQDTHQFSSASEESMPVRYVRELLDKCELPALRAWREWRDREKAGHDDLILPFEPAHV